MASSSRKNGPVVRFAYWLEAVGPTVGKEAGPYLFGLACLIAGIQFPKLTELSTGSKWEVAKLWGSSYSLWAVIISVLVALYSIRLQVLQARKDRLERDSLIADRTTAQSEALGCRSRLDDAEQHIGYMTNELRSTLKELSESYLRRIMRDLSLDQDSARISLYGHDADTRSFVLAGRYSIHPDHKMPNRQKLPDDQGFLSQAWTNGGQCFIELDDFADDGEYRSQVQGKCNMDDELMDTLRMKSRVYCGKAVFDLYGRTGIVMIESTRKGSLNEQNLLACLEDKNEVLNDLIRRNSIASPFMTYQPKRQQ